MNEIKHGKEACGMRDATEQQESEQKQSPVSEGYRNRGRGRRRIDAAATAGTKS